jgi:hypothetical protein
VAQGLIVDATCGVAVETKADVEDAIELYVNAVLTTLARASEDLDLSAACHERASNFTWDVLIKQIYGPLLGEALNES